MLPAWLHARSRSTLVAWVCVGSALSGCEQLLSLDGEYVLSADTSTDSGSGSGGTEADAASETGGSGGGSTETGGAGGAGGSASGGTGGDGGSSGAGGAGGVPPTGGTGGGGAGGGGAGGAPEPDAAVGDPNCRPGRYEGTFDGKHAPSFTVVAVPLTINGTITLQLEEIAPGRLAIASGALEGGLTLTGSSTNAFNGTITGEFNCATHALEQGVLTGTFAPAIAVTGTFQGTLLGTTISGKWAEQEANAAYKGSGTWTAKRTGP